MDTLDTFRLARRALKFAVVKDTAALLNPVIAAIDQKIAELNRAQDKPVGTKKLMRDKEIITWLHSQAELSYPRSQSHEPQKPAQDAQLLETRKFEAKDIARIFGIPPHMLEGKRPTGKVASWLSMYRDYCKSLKPSQQPAQDEPVAARLMDCEDCGGAGVDGDVDDRGLTFDVQCRSCSGSGKSRYFGRCANGGRCLQGCLSTEGCYWEKRAAKEQPAQDEPVAIIHDDNDGGQPYLKRLAHPLPPVGTKLYTRSQAREPLTHSELEVIVGEKMKSRVPSHAFKQGFRAAEAAHGIGEKQ